MWIYLIPLCIFSSISFNIKSIVIHAETDKILYKSTLPSKKKTDPVRIIMMYAQFNRSLLDEKIK